MRKPTSSEIYNYLVDTKDHIYKVEMWLFKASQNLKQRQWNHDKSKYSPEERDIYAVVTPQFKGTVYGTPEHKAVADLLGPAWQHHLENNDHHPGHHKNGVGDMDLMMILEMLCDWKAASQRDPNQDFSKSCKMNCEKYGLDEQLTEIVLNTAKSLGMF